MRRLPAVFALALTFGLVAVFGLSGCTDSLPTQAQEELPSKSAQGTVAKSTDDLGPSGPVLNEFTWANDEVFEMLAPNPNFPSNSADPAHRPLWVVAPQDDPHSPQHPGHAGEGPHDHVVPVSPGTFSAEWHVHNVYKPNTTEFAKTGVDDRPLTSADAVKEAEEEGVVTVVETPVVFTCPVRPHEPHSGEH